MPRSAAPASGVIRWIASVAGRAGYLTALLLAVQSALALCGVGYALILRALIDAARRHGNYNVLYNEITSGSCRAFAPELAREIEARTAALYTRLFAAARAEGTLRAEIPPERFAFFFDNLLMMLQFSYSCDYYQHRMRLYCGEEDGEDERMAEQLTRFILGAMKGEDACSTS